MMRKLIAPVEIGIVFLLAMLRIWFHEPEKTCFGYLAAAIVLAGWIMRKETFESLGLKNWVFASLGALIFVGKSISGKHLLGYAGTGRIVLFLVAYFGWALFQQLVMNAFFAKRFKECGSSDQKTAFWTGAIFAAFHFPNPVLMPLTFVGGAALSYIFLRMKSKNLYLLAFAQVLAAAIVFYAIPASMHHNFRVGPGFYTRTPPKH